MDAELAETTATFMLSGIPAAVALKTLFDVGMLPLFSLCVIFITGDETNVLLFVEMLLLLVTVVNLTQLVVGMFGTTLTPPIGGDDE